MAEKWPRGRLDGDEGSKDTEKKPTLTGCLIIILVLLGALLYLPFFMAVAGFSWRIFRYTCGCY